MLLQTMIRTYCDAGVLVVETVFRLVRYIMLHIIHEYPRYTPGHFSCVL